MATYRRPDFDAPALKNAPDCRFAPAPADGVLPDGFACTTNFPTYVKIDGEWRVPQDARMDSHLIWNPADQSLVIREFRKVRQGDLVAIADAEDGSEGMFVWAHGFDDPDEVAHGDHFSFMNSEVSREKPVDYGAIIELFRANQGDRGHIVWVIGPALVHSRGRTAMEWMIANGYCHALLSGNAVGVHDIEAALYGSTLGMRADGKGEAGGHALHMRAINEVKKAGSVRDIIASGQVQTGIMHALVTHDVPFVLAGSIRDDGPLPDTLTDALEAQEAMRAHTTRATMVVMVATALHSIAVGNMLPTYCHRPDGSLDELATIVVDQTEFLVAKLKDRGTHQAFGVVTNAQDFMRVVQLELMASETA